MAIGDDAVSAPAVAAEESEPVSITTFVFNAGASLLTSGGTTNLWANSTIKARLVDVAITPDRDDAVMTGYTGIGTDPTLASKTKATDTTNDRIVFSAANAVVASPAAAQTYGSVVTYKFVTNDGDSVPLFCLAVTPGVTDGTDLLLSVAATGLGYTQQ